MDKYLQAYATSLKNYRPETVQRDFELEAVIERVNAQLRKPRLQMGMDWRIQIELRVRANVPVATVSEEYALNRIIANDRTALHSDINRRAIAARRGMYWSSVLQKFVKAV